MAKFQALFSSSRPLAAVLLGSSFSLSCCDGRSIPEFSTKVGVPEVRRHDTATVHDYVSSSPSLNAALAVCVPNAFMLMQHYRGKTGNLVNLVLRTTGVYGLFALPFIGLFMEKSFYGE
jgi:hypothetical protein